MAHPSQKQLQTEMNEEDSCVGFKKKKRGKKEQHILSSLPPKTAVIWKEDVWLFWKQDDRENIVLMWCIAL